MFMRSTFAVTALAVVYLTLAACGGSTSNNTAANSNTRSNSIGNSTAGGLASTPTAINANGNTIANAINANARNNANSR
jgi:hypothetical protein